MSRESLPPFPAALPPGVRHVRGMDKLPPAALHPCLDYLVPPGFRGHYGLSPEGGWEPHGRGVYRFGEGAKESSLRIEVWPEPAGEDPAYVLELADVYPGHLEASWIVLNDIRSPRFNVDRTPEGEPIPFGSERRNIAEEIRALRAGLAPNQIRTGIRGFAPLIARIEGFAAAIEAELLYVVPLEYHNAIKYEQYGFTYASGLPEMEWIHAQFAPGGVLAARMDASRPFRMPEMCGTIRGRSWAIHDGVMERRWMAPRMFKIPGEKSGLTTFPGAVW